MITQGLLQEMFEYDGEYLIRKVFCGGQVKGKKAGSITRDGYFNTQVKGKRYYNHRLIYLMVYGYLPEFLDHRDGNKMNNSIDNLRPATKSQNQMNRTIKSPSGCRGVYWHKPSQKWLARVKVKSKTISLGYFHSLEEASRVATECRKKHFGEFYRE